MNITEGMTIALIVAIPPTIAGIAALIVSLKNHDAVKEVHLAINSRLDQLLALAREAGFTDGRKAEGEDRDRDKDAETKTKQPEAIK